MMRLRTLLLWLCVAPASAQTVFDPHERLDFDRPEIWAMARMDAASRFAASGDSEALPAGAFELQGELAHLPRLSLEQRTVGLNGVKAEDLNKTPVFGRIRGRFGLPGNWILELGWTPPVRVNGIRPQGLWAVGIQRAVLQGERWRLLGRLHYQQGHASGDITCPRDIAAQPPGGIGNPFGCLAPSDDRFSLRDRGAELVIGAISGRLRPFAGLAWVRSDLRTELNARVFGVIDRTRLEGEGVTRTWQLGTEFPLGDEWRARLALAWTPLKVRRPSEARAGSDDLLSLRVALSWRLR